MLCRQYISNDQELHEFFMLPSEFENHSSTCSLMNMSIFGLSLIWLAFLYYLEVHEDTRNNIRTWQERTAPVVRIPSNKRIRIEFAFSWIEDRYVFVTCRTITVKRNRYISRRIETNPMNENTGTTRQTTWSTTPTWLSSIKQTAT